METRSVFLFVSCFSHVLKKFRNWTNNQLLVQAMEPLQSRPVGMNRATRTYNVPVCTLKERLSGGVRQGTNLGPAPYLAAYEKMNWRSWFSPWKWNGEKQSGKCWQFCKVRVSFTNIVKGGGSKVICKRLGGAMYMVGVLCTPTA